MSRYRFLAFLHPLLSLDGKGLGEGEIFVRPHPSLSRKRARVKTQQTNLFPTLHYSSCYPLTAGHSLNSRPYYLVGYLIPSLDSTYPNMAGLHAITVALSSDSIRSRHLIGSSTAP